MEKCCREREEFCVVPHLRTYIHADPQVIFFIASSPNFHVVGKNNSHLRDMPQNQYGGLLLLFFLRSRIKHGFDSISYIIPAIQLIPAEPPPWHILYISVHITPAICPFEILIGEGPRLIISPLINFLCKDFLFHVPIACFL